MCSAASARPLRCFMTDQNGLRDEVVQIVDRWGVVANTYIHTYILINKYIVLLLPSSCAYWCMTNEMTSGQARTGCPFSGLCILVALICVQLRGWQVRCVIYGIQIANCSFIWQLAYPLLTCEMLNIALKLRNFKMICIRIFGEKFNHIA